MKNIVWKWGEDRIGEESFSRRFGHRSEEREIVIREDAPQDIRGGMASRAHQPLPAPPPPLRSQRERQGSSPRPLLDTTNLRCLHLCIGLLFSRVSRLEAGERAEVERE
jgi:hypothetical protein